MPSKGLSTELKASRAETQERFERMFVEISLIDEASEKRDNDLKQYVERHTETVIEIAEKFNG